MLLVYLRWSAGNGAPALAGIGIPRALAREAGWKSADINAGKMPALLCECQVRRYIAIPNPNFFL